MNWIQTRDKLPRKNELVRTKIHDKYGVRNVQPLLWTGKAWLLADGTTALYTPTHWMPNGKPQTVTTRKAA